MGGMDRPADFTGFSFGHEGRERTVYRKGEGPAVIIMHEVPGISVEVVRFARKVVDAGFTVHLLRKQTRYSPGIPRKPLSLGVLLTPTEPP